MMRQTDNAYFAKEAYEIEDEMDKLMAVIDEGDRLLNEGKVNFIR